VFDAPEGRVTLSDLFAGRSQLAVYHFMFGPDWKEGCHRCSFWADSFDGIDVHLAHRDTTFIVASNTSRANIEAYKRRMGWRFKWVSALGSEGDFKIGANEVAIGLTMPNFGVEICRQRLAPAHFNRAVINAEVYAPNQAVRAGFLDQVVPAADLATAAQRMATQLTRLNMAAHTATKLRAREQTLKAIRGAIESDDAAFRARK